MSAIRTAPASIASIPQARFAEELYRRRTELGLTQDDIAARTGLSVTYIRTLERGGANPSFSSMVAIADAFGLTLRELLESMDRKSATPGEAARLFDEAPEAVQKSLLELVKSSVDVIDDLPSKLRRSMPLDDAPTTAPKGRRRRRK